MKKSILFSLAIAALIIACSSDTIVLQDPDCPDTLTYESNIKEIIDLTCSAENGCHGSSPGHQYVFSSYEQSLRALDNGDFEKSIRDGSMPKEGYPQLTDQEMSDLLCWIKDGYPKS